jgi:hypothetical protein
MKRGLLLALFFIAFSGSKMYAQSTTKLVEICAESAGTDATYLKDFVVQLESAGADGKPPVAKYSMVLSKNNVYRFTICNSDESEGHAVLQLFDMNIMLGSTYNPSTGKEYKSFDFQCQKTGVYHVFISFIEGKKGNAVGILSYIKTL